MPPNRARPVSEIFFSNSLTSNQNTSVPSSTPADLESVRLAEQWLADLEMYKTTLEDMASASVDKQFKDELAAVQQWFEVLSDGEKTATLYALLQQTSSIQVRFFLTVLQKMAKNDALAGVLSPTVDHSMEGLIPAPFQYPHQQNQNQPFAVNSGYPPDLRAGTPTSSRFSMDQLLPYPNQQVNNHHAHSQSQSGYDMNASVSLHLPSQPSSIGNFPTTNNNNNTNPLTAKQISRKDFTPWTHSDEINRPKSADVALSSPSATNLHSQFKLNPPPSQSSLANRYSTSSPPPSQNINGLGGVNNLNSQFPVSLPDDQHSVFSSLFPPMDFSGSWASAVNTPVTTSFPNLQQQSAVATNEIVNNTAMKLAALSTVNNRVVLDSDVKKYRRGNHKNGGSSSGNNNGNNNNGSSVSVSGSSSSNPQSRSISNDSTAYEANFVKPVAMHPSHSNPNYSHGTSNSNNNTHNGHSSHGNTHLTHNTHTSSSLKPPSSGGHRSHSRSRSRDTNSSSLSDQNHMHNSNNSHNNHNSHHNIHNNHSSSFTSHTNSSTPGLSVSSSSSVQAPQSSSSQPSASQASVPAPSSSKDAYMDPSLLADTSAWLKVLRLHKYTPVLGSLHWKELVMLDDAQLEERGVSALGARRKMLKVFEQIRGAMENGELE